MGLIINNNRKTREYEKKKKKNGTRNVSDIRPLTKHFWCQIAAADSQPQLVVIYLFIYYYWLPPEFNTSTQYIAQYALYPSPSPL